ncbi:hypothetical protein DMENIID0001_158250 [Sergentomyia squamirostris]
MSMYEIEPNFLPSECLDVVRVEPNFLPSECLDACLTLSYKLAIVCVTFQVFIVCLVGQVLEQKSEDIYNEFCQINWHDFPINEQKFFAFCLQMAQRNYGIRAGGMYNINMMMFLQIVKLGVTYCAIIQTVMK